MTADHGLIELLSFFDVLFIHFHTPLMVFFPCFIRLLNKLIRLIVVEIDCAYQPLTKLYISLVAEELKFIFPDYSCIIISTLTRHLTSVIKIRKFR